MSMKELSELLGRVAEQPENVKRIIYSQLHGEFYTNKKSLTVQVPQTKKVKPIKLWKRRKSDETKRHEKKIIEKLKLEGALTPEDLARDIELIPSGKISTAYPTLLRIFRTSPFVKRQKVGKKIQYFYQDPSH